MSGCSDSGSVGGAIGEPGSDLVIDTLETTSYDTVALESYSGANTFFSAGQFQDPLFGDVTAMGLLEPTLPNKLDSVFVDDSTQIRLRMAINKQTVYGDTLAEAQFEFREIQERWRAPAWRLHDEVELASGTPVASFTVADQDSIDIPLSDEWVQKYGEFYNRTDSTRNTDFARNFFGFAMVAQNSSKIITVDPAETRFIIEELDNRADITQPDSISVNLGDYAYSLYRSNEAASEPNTTKIYNTLERVITLDFNFDSDVIRPVNIAKAELVIYRDDIALQQSISQAAASAVRPNTGPIRMHFVEGDELPQSIDPGAPLTPNGGIYNAEDEAYHFDITPLIKGRFFQQADSSLSIYLSQGSNDGVIRSNIVFNDAQEIRKAPQIIITSTNNR